MNLSPMEQATIDRFGIHDLDICEGILSHDVLPCDVEACGEPTVVHVIVHCCASHAELCTTHWERVVERVATAKGRLECNVCSTRFPRGATLTDILTAVKR